MSCTVRSVLYCLVLSLYNKNKKKDSENSYDKYHFLSNKESAAHLKKKKKEKKKINSYYTMVQKHSFETANKGKMISCSSMEQAVGGSWYVFTLVLTGRRL